MSLPGRCLSAGTVVLNYGATNMAPAQKDQPLLSSKRTSYFQTHKSSWNERKFGHESQRDPKPRISALARTSSNLLLCYANRKLNPFAAEAMKLFIQITQFNTN
jgi:hypothetical protein